MAGAALQLGFRWYRMRPVVKFLAHLQSQQYIDGQATASTSEPKALRKLHIFTSAGTRYHGPLGGEGVGDWPGGGLLAGHTDCCLTPSC